MPNGESPQGGIYSPLSQTMTDSESEEEIHNSMITRNHIQRNSNISGSGGSMSFHHHNSISSNSIGGGHGRDSINSSMTDMQCNSFMNFNSDGEERQHQTDADNVAILGMASKKHESMSPMRRFCFVISILACFLTVILFLWVVPCDEGSTCPAYVDRIKTHNWLNNYTKIELKGVVNVVDGLRSWERNLIFMYRGDKFFPEFGFQNNRKQNGIISLIGNSGAIAWFDEMINEPIAIDCTLIDADKNGKPDCLVIDEYGQLGVINPVSGQWLWKFIEKSSVKVDVLNFPLILPDIDGDGVYELLFATTEGEDVRNSIRIISGHTGQPIGDAYRVKDCTYVHKFQLNEQFLVGFNCICNDTEVQRFKSLPDLYSLTTNKSLGQKLTLISRIAQHKLYGQRKETESQRSIYSISGKELIVDNKGKCPENCNVTFTLTEDRNGKTHIIRNFSGSMMYGMVPAQLSFRTKDGKNKISGFVMKFWEWSKNNSEFLNLRQNRHHKRSYAEHDSPSNSYDRTEFNLFEDLIYKRRSYTVSSNDRMTNGIRLERSVTNITRDHMESVNTRSGSNIFLNNYKMQLIRETVVLIIFNSADTHIENTSQSNIVQFCRTENKEMLCQPDLNYQENSILIADLDQDGSQELLSYYTTFVNRMGSENDHSSNRNKNEGNSLNGRQDQDKKDWKLVTYVTMLRLESELPILYDDIKRN